MTPTQMQTMSTRAHACMHAFPPHTHMHTHAERCHYLVVELARPPVVLLFVNGYDVTLVK